VSKCEGIAFEFAYLSRSSSLCVVCLVSEYFSFHFTNPHLQGDMKPGQPTTYDEITASDKAAMQVPG
jgi:hypothetical protein